MPRIDPNVQIVENWIAACKHQPSAGSFLISCENRDNGGTVMYSKRTVEGHTLGGVFGIHVCDEPAEPKERIAVNVCDPKLVAKAAAARSQSKRYVVTHLQTGFKVGEGIARFSTAVRLARAYFYMIHWQGIPSVVYFPKAVKPFLLTMRNYVLKRSAVSDTELEQLSFFLQSGATSD